MWRIGVEEPVGGKNFVSVSRSSLAAKLQTFVEHLVEGAGDYPQLRVGRIADLHHQRDPDDSLGLVLRLGHVVVQLLVEAV